MALEIKGKIHEIFDTVVVTDKFKKREFVLEIDDNTYKQFVKFQMNQDKCSVLDNYSEGEEVLVAFNLTGKAGTNKSGESVYYNNIVCWKITAQSSNGFPAPQEKQEKKTMSPSTAFDEEDSGLPF